MVDKAGKVVTSYYTSFALFPVTHLSYYGEILQNFRPRSETKEHATRPYRGKNWNLIFVIRV